MKSWQTIIEVNPNNNSNNNHFQRSEINTERVHQTNPISIEKGIFQGNCLNALWFCMSLKLLSNLLKTTNIGFDKRYDRSLYKINHLVYMDDLKLYVASKNRIDLLVLLLSKFSSDIKMKMKNVRQ